ncbi:hypothetical protein LY78DRAFT_300252 [Colletotrichum sublineola]|nr:hypothetical protein LY78DRAFT_300252 [Colletotrichum sublineola]
MLYRRVECPRHCEHNIVGQYLTSTIGNSAFFPLRPEHRDPLAAVFGEYAVAGIPRPRLWMKSSVKLFHSNQPYDAIVRERFPLYHKRSLSRYASCSSPEASRISFCWIFDLSSPIPIALKTRIHPSQAKSGSHIGTPSENSIAFPGSSHTYTNAFNTYPSVTCTPDNTKHHRRQPSLRVSIHRRQVWSKSPRHGMPLDYGTRCRVTRHAAVL